MLCDRVREAGLCRCCLTKQPELASLTQAYERWPMRVEGCSVGLRRWCTLYCSSMERSAIREAGRGGAGKGSWSARYCGPEREADICVMKRSWAEGAGPGAVRGRVWHMTNVGSHESARMVSADAATAVAVRARSGCVVRRRSADTDESAIRSTSRYESYWGKDVSAVVGAGCDIRDAAEATRAARLRWGERARSVRLSMTGVERGGSGDAAATVITASSSAPAVGRACNEFAKYRTAKLSL